MEKEIGAEGKLSLELADGKIKIMAGYDGKQVDAGLTVAIDTDQFVDKLAALIPGDSGFEAAMVAALKIALRSVKV